MNHDTEDLKNANLRNIGWTIWEFKAESLLWHGEALLMIMC